jgi:hypothetical protein
MAVEQARDACASRRQNGGHVRTVRVSHVAASGGSGQIRFCFFDQAISEVSPLTKWNLRHRIAQRADRLLLSLVATVAGTDQMLQAQDLKG